MLTGPVAPRTIKLVGRWSAIEGAVIFIAANLPTRAHHAEARPDLPELTDYRGLVGNLVARQYGLGGDRLNTVFPGMKPAALDLI